MLSQLGASADKRRHRAACGPQHNLALSSLAPAAPSLLCSTIVASQGQADPLSIQPPSGNATEMLVSQLAG